MNLSTKKGTDQLADRLRLRLRRRAEPVSPALSSVADDHIAEHTEQTIGGRLSVRDFMEDLRATGVTTGGPPPFDAKTKREFASALDRALTRMTR